MYCHFRKISVAVSRIFLVLALTVIVASIFLLIQPLGEHTLPVQPERRFDGASALEFIRQQVAFGPRYVGSPGHDQVAEFLEKTMKQYSDETIIQQGDHLTNIIGRLNPSNSRRILLVTHYDSRQFASLDTEHPKEPVIGANNSASGVAVLLQLAQMIQNKTISPSVGVDIALFDGEEWDVDHPSDGSWRPLGSSYFVEHLKELYPNDLPIVAIDLDLVCSKTMALYQEQSSLERARSSVETFWRIARSRWPAEFIDSVKWNILDDHTVLNVAGIPSMLLIDYDYPWIHTTQDTIDKCSAKSLEAVGDSLLRFLETL